MPLGRFIGEFDGLTGSPKQKAVRAAVPGVTHLSGLEGRDDLIAALHRAMRQHAKPTPPKRLGPVGEDHLRTMLDGEYGVARWWYKADQCVVGGVPWIIEVAVADTVRPGRTWFACNHAPRSATRWTAREFDTGDIYTTGAESFLKEADADTPAAATAPPSSMSSAPRRSSRTRARSRSSSRQPSRTARGRRWTRPPRRCGRRPSRRRKDARKAERAEQRARDEAARRQRQNEWTLKEAVFEVMPEAKEAAGHIVAARTLYYKVRPLVQEYTDKELDYHYFSQTLLPDYERESGRCRACTTRRAASCTTPTTTR